MKCHEVEQSLAAYLHGEVGRSERELIRAHIAQCERCQRELARLSEMQTQLSRSLHAMADDAAPSLHAWSRLQASLTPQREPSFVSRMKQTFAFSGLGGLTFPRHINILFLASGLLISGAMLVWVVWGNPAGVNTHRPLPLPLPRSSPSQPSQPPQQGDRRISGPLDETGEWANGTRVHAPPVDHVAPRDPDIDRVIGGEWLFLQGSAEESKPFKACAQCAQLQ